jgi:hypothetical protein
MVVIVGVNGNKYVICFGDNYLYSIGTAGLSKYRLANAEISENGNVLCEFGEPDDLSHMFGDPQVEFVESIANIQSTSLGVARKFLGKSEYGYCVVKFSNYSDTCFDLDNEVLYAEIARILQVKCCKVFKTVYGGRACVLSVFDYDREKDAYKSFRQAGLSVSNIMASLDAKDRLMFLRYLILDYLVEQQDRHLSNLALVNDRLYPLFDNGDCFGLGYVKEYSKVFRDTVERLKAEDIEKTLPVTADKLKAIEGVPGMDGDRFGLFVNNFTKIYGEARRI